MKIAITLVILHSLLMIQALPVTEHQAMSPKYMSLFGVYNLDIYSGEYEGVIYKSFEHIGLLTDSNGTSEISVAVIDGHFPNPHADWVHSVIDHVISNTSIHMILVEKGDQVYLCADKIKPEGPYAEVLYQYVTAIHASMICAIEMAIELKVDLISISLGVMHDGAGIVDGKANCIVEDFRHVPLLDQLFEAFQSALDNGIQIIASSGNLGEKSLTIPACIEGVHSVAALAMDVNNDGEENLVFVSTDSPDEISILNQRAWYSSYEDAIWITPVGYSISGTSFAAPLLTAAVMHLASIVYDCSSQSGREADSRRSVKHALDLIKKHSTIVENMHLPNLRFIESNANPCSSELVI